MTALQTTSVLVGLTGLGLLAISCTLPREGALDDALDDTTMTTTASGGGSAGSSPMTATVGGGDAGQGSVAAEDCLDGIDNNGDRLTDCADPQCVPDHECVPRAPTDWVGYSRVARSAYPYMGPVLTCSDGSAPQVYFDTPGNETQCSACSCGDVTDASCTYPALSCWFNTSNCTGGDNFAASPTDANCYQFGNSNTCNGSCSNSQVCAVTQDSQVSGTPSCVASGGAATVGPMWSNENALCNHVAGGGCDADSVCVPIAPAPFDSTACITRDGEQSCPLEYPVEIQAYASAIDTRDCSGCACDPSSVSCTGASIVVYDSNSCGGNQATIAECTSVQSLIDNDAASFIATSGSLDGGCTPSGGTPTGEVTPDEPVTICCE